MSVPLQNRQPSEDSKITGRPSSSDPHAMHTFSVEQVTSRSRLVPGRSCCDQRAPPSEVAMISPVLFVVCTAQQWLASGQGIPGGKSVVASMFHVRPPLRVCEIAPSQD